MPLLASTAEYQDDGRVTCRLFPLLPHHWRETWDGVSPLPVSLDVVVKNALIFASSRKPGDYRVLSVALSASTVPGIGEVHHYVLDIAVVGSSSFIPAAFQDDGVQVFLDLRGQVVEPQLRAFASSEEYDAFMNESQA
jgi:hypothetical protein